ncbi:MAG: hypothetical protein JSS49_00445 [Planctomycetes bacterium]|nr:hypothetical protein [Planctomycetota bacterium]
MYGVGSRLDKQPELLFTLRKVDPQELVSQAVSAGNLEHELAGEPGTLNDQDLGALFGIELDLPVETTKRRTRAKPGTTAASAAAVPAPVTSTTAKPAIRKRPAKAKLVQSPVATVNVSEVEAVAPMRNSKTAKTKPSAAKAVATRQATATKVTVKKKASRKRAEVLVETAPLKSKSRRPR